MKKYIVALFIGSSLCAAPEDQSAAERYIRLSSVAESLKERIERLSRYESKLTSQENQVIQKAREWYTNLKDHHADAKNKKRTATIPESVYDQVHQVLQLLEAKARIHTAHGPIKQYIELPSSRAKFKHMLSLEFLQTNRYWEQALELTGVGIVLFIVYKIFRNHGKPEIVVINGESNQITEEQPVEAALN